MKKSQAVRLVLLGTATAALSACGDSGAPPKDARYFADRQECSTVYGDKACDDAKTAADQKHVAEAPRFGRKDECEAEYGVGNCETRQASGGGSFFMPLLAGYMIGNMLGGGSRYAQPVYRDRDNNAVTPAAGGASGAYRVGSFGSGAGTPAGTSTGTGTGRAATFRPAAQVTQISRGGFGSTAARFSGTGG